MVGVDVSLCAGVYGRPWVYVQCVCVGMYVCWQLCVHTCVYGCTGVHGWVVRECVYRCVWVIGVHIQVCMGG